MVDLIVSSSSDVFYFLLLCYISIVRSLVVVTCFVRISAPGEDGGIISGSVAHSSIAAHCLLVVAGALDPSSWSCSSCVASSLATAAVVAVASMLGVVPLYFGNSPLVSEAQRKREG